MGYEITFLYLFLFLLFLFQLEWISLSQELVVAYQNLMIIYGSDRLLLQSYMGE